MTEAVLRTWGGDKDVAAGLVGRAPDATEERSNVLVWWMTTVDAERAQESIRAAHLNICAVVETEHPREITVAVVTLRFEGREYVIEQGFGYGYPADSAEFMFREGNYSCDCNKRAMLSERYADIADSDRCGDSIPIVRLAIEHRSGATIDPPDHGRSARSASG